MITLEDISVVAIHKFAAFASDLGLRVGSFPAALDTNLGNSLPFVAVSVKSDKAVYRQSGGCLELEVFND